MSTALVSIPATSTLITAEQLQQVIALDETIRQTNREVVEAEKSGNEMLKAIVMAKGMQLLRDGLTPLMPVVMQLAGTPMGFRTDKDRPRWDDDKKKWDDSKYSADEVRDVLIVGLLRGFRVVHNEINVIASNFYATKNGMKRLVLEYPGMNKFRIVWGVPATFQGGALVPALATWELNGVPDQLDCRVTKRGESEDDMRIPVRVNKGMGTDAIIGKAESKICRRVYEILTGIVLPSVDEIDVGDDPNTIDTTGSVVDDSRDESQNSNQATSDGQHFEPDLDELYRQYVDELNNSETMDDSMAAHKKFFDSELYKWSSYQRSKALRVLEKRQDAIREECGKKSAGAGKTKDAKSQKQFA